MADLSLGIKVDDTEALKSFDDMADAAENIGVEAKDSSKKTTKATKKMSVGMKAFTKATKKTGAVAKKTFTDMVKVVNKAGTAIKGVKNALSGPAGLLAGLGLVAASYKVFSGIIDEGISLQKMADNTGIAVDKLEEWRIITELAGGGMDNLTDAVQDFTEKMGEAAMDSKSSWAGAFRTIGVTLSGVTPAINDTLRALANMVDEGKKSEAFFVGVDLFGDAFKTTFSSMVKDGIIPFEKRLKKIQDLKVFNSKFTSQITKVVGVVREASLKIKKYFSSILEDGGLDVLGGTLDFLTNKFGKSGKKIGEDGKKLGQSFKDSIINDAIPALKTFGTTMIDVAGAIEKGANTLKGLFGFVEKDVDGVIMKTIPAFEYIADTIKIAFMEAFEFIRIKLHTTFIDMSEEFDGFGETIQAKLFKGMAGAIGGKSIYSDIDNQFKKDFDELVSAVDARNKYINIPRIDTDLDIDSQVSRLKEVKIALENDIKNAVWLDTVSNKHRQFSIELIDDILLAHKKYESERSKIAGSDLSATQLEIKALKDKCKVTKDSLGITEANNKVEEKSIANKRMLADDIDKLRVSIENSSLSISDVDLERTFYISPAFEYSDDDLDFKSIATKRLSEMPKMPNIKYTQGIDVDLSLSGLFDIGAKLDAEIETYEYSPMLNKIFGTKEERDALISEIKQGLGDVFNATVSMGNAFMNHRAARYGKELSDLKEKHKEEAESFKGNAKQKAKFMEKQAAEEKKIEDKIAEQKKKSEIANVWVSTASSIAIMWAKYLAAFAGPQIGIGIGLATAMSALLLTTAGVQTSAIAKYEDGGVVGGFVGASAGPDTTTIKARKGEMYLNAGQQKKLFEIANGRGSNNNSLRELKVNRGDIIINGNVTEETLDSIREVDDDFLFKFRDAFDTLKSSNELSFA